MLPCPTGETRGDIKDGKNGSFRRGIPRFKMPVGESEIE